jgi:hypothetical protein
MPAEYYRRRAARVRELAAGTTTPAIKDHLHDVARQYDRLAEGAEKAARVGAQPDRLG